MATITQETRIELSGRESILLGPLPGHVIRCRHGELWLTVERDGRDVILGPGRTWRVTGDGPVVISAFKDSAFSVRPNPPRMPGFAGIRHALALLFARPNLSIH